MTEAKSKILCFINYFQKRGKMMAEKMEKIFQTLKNLLHSLGIHDWDNKEDGFFSPKNTFRECKLCSLKQKWIASSPHMACLTDKPMGKWIDIS